MSTLRIQPLPRVAEKRLADADDSAPQGTCELILDAVAFRR